MLSRSILLYNFILQIAGTKVGIEGCFVVMIYFNTIIRLSPTSILDILVSRISIKNDK